MRTAGIIGGLGPETTAEFYMEIIHRARKVYTEAYPRILIYSVPVSFQLEQGIVGQGKGEEQMLPLLTEAVQHLERSGADFVVLPCNTVHIFHSQMQSNIHIPLLNILKETASVCQRNGWKKVGVLGTVKTIKDRIYESALQEHGISPISLPSHRLDALGQLICRILSETQVSEDRSLLIDFVNELKSKGAEGVILGCTDLQLLIKENDADLPVPVLDSMRCLADAVVKNLAE